MSLNLAYIVERSARHFRDEVALIHDERRLTFGELAQCSRRMANVLRDLGIQRGDHVAMMLPNIPEFTIVYFGILYAGATVVPINFLSVDNEIAYFLEDSDAKVFVTHSMYAEAAMRGAMRAPYQPQVVLVDEAGQEGALAYEALMSTASDVFDIEQTMPDDTAVILYTSGTTGRSKGAELTHFNMYENARWCAELGQSIPPTKMVYFGPGHVGMGALPLFHSFGQTVVQNAMLFHGAAMTLMPRWDAEEALRIIERDRVTFFAGVPTMYFGLLQATQGRDVNVDTVQFCNSGGAPMPVEVMQEFDAKFGVEIREGYGLSETSPVATFHTPERPRKIGSIGWPIEGCEVKIFDDNDHEVPVGEVGEVVIRGANILKGYYKRPDATAEALRNGWFHSGDLGRVDEDGYVYIVDRKKDMILRGGFNVYPREVEEVLYAHPAVREAAVVGVPDAEHGEEIKAIVSLREGCTLTEAELRAYCREKMAAYKYPRIYEFRDELPKGPTGKILKRELRG